MWGKGREEGQAGRGRSVSQMLLEFGMSLIVFSDTTDGYFSRPWSLYQGRLKIIDNWGAALSSFPTLSSCAFLRVLVCDITNKPFTLS